MEFTEQSRFTSDFFVANRRRLRELFTGTAPIVITANGQLQRGGDSTFRFAQDANFWYLTGIDEPDIILVMDRSKEYLIVPERTHSRELFDGAVAYDVLSQRSGIANVYGAKEGWDMLAGRAKKVKHVATIAPPPAYIEDFAIYTNPSRASLVEKLKTINESLQLLDLAPHMGRLRMVKQAPEIAAIQAAIDVTIRSIKEALKPAKLRRYTHEYHLEAELSRGFRLYGGSGHAFDPIIASGGRSCLIHYLANNGELSADELLLMDVGAEVEHYAADISRTVSLSTPSRRQQNVHAAVLEVQEHAFSILQPGALLRDCEQSIEHFMGEKLRELGLIKTISHENVRKFFPHATFHFLGLNVHDFGDYDRPLEPGVVLAVEPGIYIPDEAIGVRIEDNILITASGNKVLTKKLSRDLKP